MKRFLGLLAILFTSATMMGQGTPQQQRELKHDLVKEREKRHDVAKDVITGHPARARADHRAAVSYHNQIHRDANRIHEADRSRAQYYARHRPVKHYRSHRTVVVVRH